MSMDPDLFNDIYGDLPDGAFFAMAEEMGVDLESLGDEDDEE